MNCKGLSRKGIFTVSVLLAMLFGIFVLSGCNVQKSPAPTQPTPTPAPAQQSTEDAQRTKMLAQKISSLEEVNSATVVLSDNNAWVGIDMKAAPTGAMTDELKNRITDLVKKEDKAIQTVYVTADADTVTRLKNIAQDIAAGKPVSGFIQELNEMGRRVTPSAK